jgi:hypothetical protein
MPAPPRPAVRLAAALAALLLPSRAPAAEAPAGAPIAAGLRLAAPDLEGPPRAGPNRWLPPLEVLGVTAVLSAAGRLGSADSTFDTSWDSFVDHLDGPWWYDTDRFATNQLGHPYQGHLYFASARSLGHGFWSSSAHACAGSLLWELGMELEPPSVNDQITTTVAGSFLGEILHRLSGRIIDGGGASPSLWRRIAAAAVSPMDGLNRLLSGDRHRPAAEPRPLAGELKLSYRNAALVQQDGTESDPSRAWLVSAKLVQGFPGGGHAFAAPFDYFDLTVQAGVDRQVAGRSMVGDFSIHGLLVGAPYGAGEQAGVVGLFGSYDYLTPTNFRASSSALGVGTVGQATLGDFLLQGQALLSVGYGAGGALRQPVGRRDYHFGLQGVLYVEAGLVWRDSLGLALTTRQYLISGKASAEPGSWEDMTFSQLDLTWRLHGPHAVKLELGGARRRAHYDGSPDLDQRAGTVAVAYAWQLGDTLTYSRGPR